MLIAVMVAVTFLNFNSNEVTILLTGASFTIPPILFGLLVVVLVWVSINVTNCSDGVDGLSGTLTIITLMIIYLVDLLQSRGDSFSYLILLFCVCILGYLWYNATPSRLMMGDAGSRAMGLFISIAVLKTGSPFLYIPVALVLILDGGLGLVKIFLLRFLKIRILTKVRTPLHDQARKVWGVVQHPDSIPVCHHTDYAGSRSYFYCDVIPFVRTGKGYCRRRTANRGCAGGGRMIE